MGILCLSLGVVMLLWVQVHANCTLSSHVWKQIFAAIAPGLEEDSVVYLSKCVQHQQHPAVFVIPLPYQWWVLLQPQNWQESHIKSDVFHLLTIHFLAQSGWAWDTCSSVLMTRVRKQKGSCLINSSSCHFEQGPTRFKLGHTEDQHLKTKPLLPQKLKETEGKLRAPLTQLTADEWAAI